MLRTVVAISRDGLDLQVQTMLFQVPDEKFNLEYWVRKAATDYCLTKEGREVYEDNCECFNWSDFAMHVPNEFCEKYGFALVESNDLLSDIEVNLDEHLVDDDALAEADEDGDDEEG